MARRDKSRTTDHGPQVVTNRRKIFKFYYHFLADATYRFRPVPQKRLHKILQDLRDELGVTEALNEEDRSLLTAVVDQIHGTIGESGEMQTGESPLLRSLDDAALHFEAEHPRLTKTLFQISELLRSAGLS